MTRKRGRKSGIFLEKGTFYHRVVPTFPVVVRTDCQNKVCGCEVAEDLSEGCVVCDNGIADLPEAGISLRIVVGECVLKNLSYGRPPPDVFREVTEEDPAAVPMLRVVITGIDAPSSCIQRDPGDGTTAGPMVVIVINGVEGLVKDIQQYLHSWFASPEVPLDAGR